jgi:hypothetical protein
MDPQTKQNITFIERQKLSNWSKKILDHQERLQHQRFKRKHTLATYLSDT